MSAAPAPRYNAPRKFRPGLHRHGTPRRRIGKDCYAPLVDVYLDDPALPTFQRGRYLPLAAWAELGAEPPAGLVLSTSHGQRAQVVDGRVVSIP